MVLLSPEWHKKERKKDRLPAAALDKLQSLSLPRTSSPGFQRGLLSLSHWPFFHPMGTHTGLCSKLRTLTRSSGFPAHIQPLCPLSLWVTTLAQSYTFLHTCVSCVKCFSNKHWLIQYVIFWKILNVVWLPMKLVNRWISAPTYHLFWRKHLKFILSSFWEHI